MDTGRTEEKPAIEYTAQAVSPIVNGEVKLTIGENSFSAIALFGAVEVLYAKVNALDFTDYVITVKTDEGDYTFSRMGQWAQPFYDALCEAYNKAVLRAFFVSGEPLFKANGEYRFKENGMALNGKAPVYVYENCIVALPPNDNARRIPLCFTTGMDKGDYELTIRLNTGETYTFAKLGYDTAMFAEVLEKQIRALREKALATAKALDPSLTAMQGSQLACIMPEGAAASVGDLIKIAPSFVAALEAGIADTRAVESYAMFKEMSDPAQIWAGIMKNETQATDANGSDGDGAGADGSSDVGDIAGMLGGLTGGGNPLEVLGGLTGNASPNDEKTETPQPAPYLFWMIAPSPDGRYMAVEFTEANTATFVYGTSGDFSMAAAQLNRALEAISFKREVIRLTNEELMKPENADYYMAAKRTASLQFIRGRFTGRVVHSSPEAWKRRLTEMWSAE